MEGNSRIDRGRTALRAGRSGTRRVLCTGLAPALGWIALTVFACADPPHPLEARCLEALAYRSPNHGDVESMERTPTDAGIAVSIRYRVEAPPEGPSHRYVLCEFAEGDRWALHQMIHEGQVLHEPELALVNSELLLWDLANNPERFEERRQLAPKPAAPDAPVGGESPVAPAEPEVVSDSAVAQTPARATTLPVRPRPESDSGAMRSPNSNSSHASVAAAPKTQIPSPSSGGSD